MHSEPAHSESEVRGRARVAYHPGGVCGHPACETGEFVGTVIEARPGPLQTTYVVQLPCGVTVSCAGKVIEPA